MQIRNLGGSGLRVSAVGLGCNNFGQRIDLETSRKVIHKAIDLGVTLFDTADIYAGMGGSETVLGEVLGDRRKDIVLATKFSKPMSHDGTKQGASRRYIMSAVEASLTRLKTDYIDLYQQHDYDPADADRGNLARAGRPDPAGQGPLHRQFEFPGLAHRRGRIHRAQINVSRFVSCQDEYSLVVREIEQDLLPAARQYRLGLLPFFPLASGLLTGKYQRGAAAPDDTRFAKAPGAARPLCHAAQRGHRRQIAGLRPGARPQHAGAGLLMAGVAAAGVERDRRRHPGRTDRGERQGDRLDAQRRRYRRDRPDHGGVNQISPSSFRDARPWRSPESITTNFDESRSCRAAVPLTTAIGGYGFRARTGRAPGMTTYPTSPLMPFTGALSGKTVSASTRSESPRWSRSTPLTTARRSVVGARSRA